MAIGKKGSLVQLELNEWWLFISAVWFVATTCFAPGEEDVILTHNKSVLYRMKAKKCRLLVLFHQCFH